ncbi:phosphate/phosphite/phosphonate ABC transporter substrate-binding protein [Gemmata sp. JC717]|uniref:Phosphate/phosphite/phosphonate ABC transporter substrate-binding protein n=1 Tax=Gemmata algarum TaxID=2975278 RepID=A0ABU5F452_9BACT|nr:phosphate/phosphite/phosphonate ABC transporter substrate-binding protein [Gemmata algarum]MDY3551109.1 phosphate/phosphite/phosphonate ABC transporter substrate-binding protein [Gemmata algarum]MDY3561979.1 phosphate/phosphite/phosphonate ABC transporter substrate-binding protein [Gemmata algarum]
MGRVYAVIVCCLLPVAVAVVPSAPRAAAAEPVAPARIGLPANMFSGLPAPVVQRASRPFQNMLEKQAGLKGEVTVGKDYTELAEMLRGGKLELAVFHGFEFAWVKQHPELVPLVVTVPTNKLQACLVVNVNSKADGPHALKGESVAIPSGTKAHCQLYYDRLKDAAPAGCCEVAKLKGRTVEDALDAVSDAECPAALVDAGALVAYQKLKPGAGQQLKVLAQSEPFPPGVLVYRKGALTEEAAKQVRDGLVKCVNTDEGQLLTSLWRLKGFEAATQAYQLDLDKCLKVYPAPKQK